MARFRGKITAGGQVVLADVEGEVFMHAPPGRLKSWNGEFDLQKGQFVGPGSYRLELEDGRSGDIIISNVHFSSHSSASVEFVGSGPLQ
jgi:hypothetical protein